MKTREEIIRLLAKDKPVLQAQFKMQSMAIFGSYARGDQREDSDVDVLVDVDPSIGLKFVSLAEQMEKVLGLHVDLVSRRAIKPRNMKIIERELIYV